MMYNFVLICLVQIVENATKLIEITSWLADDKNNYHRAPAFFENVGYFSDWIKDGIRTLLKGIVTENSTDQDNIVFL